MNKARIFLFLLVLILASCRSEDVPGTSMPAGESPSPSAEGSTDVYESTPVVVEETAPTDLPVPTATNPAVSSTARSISGIHVHSLSTPKQVQLAQQGGAYWTRFDDFNWAEIEPVRLDPPVYHWETVDEVGLQLAASSGFEIIGMVLFTPSWAQKYPGIACGPVAEAAINDFARFLEALVKRYSQPPYHVQFWEIGNEPDIAYNAVGGNSGFGCWGEPGDAYFGGGYYGKVLKSIYPAIKTADPDAQVLVGGLLLNCDPDNPPETTPGSGQFQDCSSSRFLEGILVESAGDSFDGVSFHAYDYFLGNGTYGNSNWNSASQDEGPVLINKTRFVRSVLASYGITEKGLYNTEVAILCGRDGNEPGCVSDDFFNTKANYAAQANAAALAAGINSNIWYSLTGWRASGLVQPSLDSLPLPVLDAYKFSARKIDQSHFVTEITQFLGVKGYEILQDEKRIWILWSRDGEEQTIQPESSPAAIFDVYGESVEIQQSIQVSLTTLYIEWEP